MTDGHPDCSSLTVDLLDANDHDSTFVARSWRRPAYVDVRADQRDSRMCSSSLAVEWNRDFERRPPSGWAFDPHSPAEGLDPVCEPDEP
jgi:hypothetical protein